MRRQKLSEAATIKARARRITRELDELLTDKTLPDSVRRQVSELRDALAKTWSQLRREAGEEHGRKGVAAESTGESMAKTVGGKSVPASSFLVVEDPERPSTFHLQVKDENGKPDHRLMGAAWAALHQGYRGNKYEGPNKAKALEMLKKMYDDEGMAMPAESAEAEPVAEYDADFCYVPTTITSFAQLRAAQTAQEIAGDMREAVEQFQQMLQNIFFWSSPDQVPDKVGAATGLFDEFIGVMDQILSGQDEGESSSMAGSEAATPEPSPEPVAEGEPESFSESEPVIISLVEEAGDANPRGPLEMDVQLIQPGWGNSRDNHYYPADMLRRCAEVFVGAKMYETDHRPEEKSTRTEVSQIKKIVGFTEGGAPIARVSVFDPDFAEKCRNRKKAGLLESLECSILADGKARPGFEEGGRKGKVVEAITSVSSVDWVTRAGAGGHAVGLAESDAQPEEPPAEEPAAESSEPQPVTIQEQEPPTEESVSVETAAPAAEPGYLSLDTVRELLAQTNLPGKSLLELIGGQYPTREALQETIAAEIKRIKEITGSGRPFALGEAAPVEKAPVSQSKIEETMDAVNKRFGFGR